MVPDFYPIIVGVFFIIGFILFIFLVAFIETRIQRPLYRGLLVYLFCFIIAFAGISMGIRMNHEMGKSQHSRTFSHLFWDLLQLKESGQDKELREALELLNSDFSRAFHENEHHALFHYIHSMTKDGRVNGPEDED